MTGAAPAAAQAPPPAAIDQYLPAPPGAPDPSPGPGKGDGNGNGNGNGKPGGGESPSSGERGLTPEGQVTERGLTPKGQVEDLSPEGSDPVTGEGVANNPAARKRAKSNSAELPSTGPSFGGYPLTGGVALALILLAVAAAAALGYGAWRRYRSGVPLGRG